MTLECFSQYCFWNTNNSYDDTILYIYLTSIELYAYTAATGWDKLYSILNHDVGWFAKGRHNHHQRAKWEISSQTYKLSCDSSWGLTSAWEIKYPRNRCSYNQWCYFLYFKLPSAVMATFKNKLRQFNNLSFLIYWHGHL